MQPNSIFIMGATGRVGNAVIDALPDGVQIRAATQRKRHGDAVDWVQFALEDEQTFAAALDGVHAIFLMRPPQITKGSAFVPFLQAAQEHNIKRIVVLSVAGADENDILPHHAMEKVVMEMGFDWTMIRPSDFMQNLETVHLESIRDRDEIAVPAGQGRSAFIDVADIGEVIAKSFLEEGHSRKGYTLTGPKALNFDEVTQVLTEVLGRPIRYRQIGAVQFLFEQVRRGQPIGISLVMTALYTVQRLGKASAITGDVERLLGRAPNDLRHYAQMSKVVWKSKHKSS